MSKLPYYNNHAWIYPDEQAELPVGKTTMQPYKGLLKCECGAEVTYGAAFAQEAGLHTDYCPLYGIKPLFMPDEITKYIPM